MLPPPTALCWTRFEVRRVPTCEDQDAETTATATWCSWSGITDSSLARAGSMANGHVLHGPMWHARHQVIPIARLVRASRAFVFPFLFFFFFLEYIGWLEKDFIYEFNFILDGLVIVSVVSTNWSLMAKGRTRSLVLTIFPTSMDGVR
jgi:hypothetical protein